MMNRLNLIVLLSSITFLQAAPQHWRSDWVDELMVDEWPVEDTQESSSGLEATFQTPSKSTLYDQDYDQSIISVVSIPQPSQLQAASSFLQQQEEQVLAQLDQEIVATLQQAVDKVTQDRPIRVISLEDATAQVMARSSYHLLLFPLGLLIGVIFFVRLRKVCHTSERRIGRATHTCSVHRNKHTFICQYKQKGCGK